VDTLASDNISNSDRRIYPPHFLIILLLLIMIFAAFPRNLADPDLWGYLAFGRLFWETGRLPYNDVFSYVTTKQVWIYHEWLTGILFYPLYKYTGGTGLQCLKIFLGLGTVALMCVTARLRGAQFWGLVFIIFLTKGFLSFGYSPVRAQIFTYFFFVLTLFLLESGRQENRWWRLAWLVPIQILWCNFHGGFLAGLGLVAIYAVGEALSGRIFWPYGLVLLSSGLATLINPYGMEYWSFILDAASMPRPEIPEWFSLIDALQNGLDQGQVYYFITLTIFAAALMWQAKWKDLTAGLALAVTWYLGYKHLRHQVFFYLLMGAYLGGPFSLYLTDLVNRLQIPEQWRRLDRRLILVGYLVTFSYFAYQVISHGPLSLETPEVPGAREEIYYPAGAVTYIRSHNLCGKLLADFNWGEYLLWELYPQCQVAIDGRYETVYPEKVVRSYMNFRYVKSGWQDFLEEYPPDMILLPKISKIFNLMQKSPNWREAYADRGCGLFVRKEREMRDTTLGN
jgi:hypothetical protein